MTFHARQQELAGDFTTQNIDIDSQNCVGFQYRENNLGSAVQNKPSHLGNRPGVCGNVGCHLRSYLDLTNEAPPDVFRFLAPRLSAARATAAGPATGLHDVFPALRGNTLTVCVIGGRETLRVVTRHVVERRIFFSVPADGGRDVNPTLAVQYRVQVLATCPALGFRYPVPVPVHTIPHWVCVVLYWVWVKLPHYP